MLQPAASLLNRYSFKTKFKVIGAAIAALLIIPVAHLTVQQVADIRFIGSELDGVAASKPLRQLLEKITNLRTAQNSSAADAAAQVAKAQKELDAAIKGMDDAVGDYSNFKLAEPWKTLKPTIQGLKTVKPNEGAGSQLYNTALRKTDELFVTVADRSKLSFDPVLVTNYLMNNSFNYLPTLVVNSVALSSPAGTQHAQAKKEAKKEAAAPAAEENAFGDAFGDAVPADAPAPAAEPAATPEPAATTTAATTASAPVASTATASAATAVAAAPAAAPVAASPQATSIYQAISRIEDANANLAASFDKITAQNPDLKNALQKSRREFNISVNDYIENAHQLLENPGKSIAESEADLHQTLYRLFDENHKQLEEQLALRHSDKVSALLWELCFIAVVTVLLLLIFRTMNDAILKSMHKLSDGVRRMAEGNLLTVIETGTQDEMHTIANDLNHMASELRSMIAIAQTSSKTLYEQVEALHQSSQNMAEHSKDQTTAASSMASSIEELSVSIGQVSAHAQHSSEVSNQTRAISIESGEVIHRMAEEMSTISESVRTTATAIESLGEHSDKIASVVQVIKEVAAQTNLLALNAAIEAARAGEQGRGFAVVADEVRKLAERTTRSTIEISEIIESIQDATMNAILSMGSVVTRVNEGVELADSAGTAINKIKDQGEQTQSVVHDISVALQEQSATSKALAEVVQQIASGSQSNSQAAQSTAATAESMYELAQQIQESVEHFKA